MPKKEIKSDVLTLLCAAVAAYYKDKGDKTQAGVVISCLEFDPPDFYASVARYPHGPRGPKEVVCKAGGPGGMIYHTAEEVVDALATKWFSMVKPAPVADTLDALGAVLK